MTETKEQIRDRYFKEKNHVGMMYDASLWGKWPILPLKNGPGIHDCKLGFLHVDYPHVVFLGNIFETRMPTTVRETYNSFEEVAAAGWEVD